MSASVYVHVPFCLTRCPYCAFYSGEPLDALASYPALIEQEARLRAQGGNPLARPLETIYFGGGTPSLLGAPAVGALLDAFARIWGIAPEAEVTLEVNPGDVVDLAALRTAGVNRLSVGVQALDDRVLERFGRRHSAAQALRAVSHAAAAGMRTSADLLFGAVPLASDALSDWVRTLRSAGVEHVSVYSLEFHPGTSYAREREAGLLPALPPSEEEAQWDELHGALRAAGFEPYEVSNYCRPGAPCRHNLVYWAGEGWLGLGPGAHSFAPALGPWGTRSWNHPGLEAYAAALASDGLPPGASEELTADAALLETLFLALRRPEPIDFENLAHRHRGRPEALLARLRQAASEGLFAAAPDAPGTLAPTFAGMRAADGLALWLQAAFQPQDDAETTLVPAP